MSGVCTTSFNNEKIELFEGVSVDTRFFPVWYELHMCLAVLSADRKFSIPWLPNFDDLSISVRTIYILEC